MFQQDSVTSRKPSFLHTASELVPRRRSFSASARRGQGVRRIIYVTFLGTRPDSPSAWVRGRWEAEQLLLKSGLDVTVIRPGQIVGVGGGEMRGMVA